MNRRERRYRTEKIARKRFSQAYCDYNGKPNAWFLQKYTEKEQRVAKGKCRERLYKWRCRCEYCMGGKFLRDRRSIQDFYFGMLEIQKLWPCLDPNPQKLKKEAVSSHLDSALNGDHEIFYECHFPVYLHRGYQCSPRKYIR